MHHQDLSAQHHTLPPSHLTPCPALPPPLQQSNEALKREKEELAMTVEDLEEQVGGGWPGLASWGHKRPDSCLLPCC